MLFNKKNLHDKKDKSLRHGKLNTCNIISNIKNYKSRFYHIYTTEHYELETNSTSKKHNYTQLALDKHTHSKYKKLEQHTCKTQKHKQN